MLCGVVAFPWLLALYCLNDKFGQSYRSIGFSERPPTNGVRFELRRRRTAIDDEWEILAISAQLRQECICPPWVVPPLEIRNYCSEFPCLDFV